MRKIGNDVKIKFYLYVLCTFYAVDQPDCHYLYRNYMVPIETRKFNQMCDLF